MKSCPHIIILGGGISGLAAAWRLLSLGLKVTVLESNAQTGGLAGTVRNSGYCLDFGPHSFFSEDQEILKTVLGLFEPPLQSFERHVRFYFNGRYLHYPLTAASVLFQMGPQAGLQAALSYLKEQFISSQSRGIAVENVETWATSHFGNYLYRSFFKPYTEQFWKIPCTELSPRVIPSHTRMNFTKALGLLLTRRISKANPSMIERERLPTYYPATGYGEIAEQVAQKVRDLGGQIHLQCPALKLTRLAHSQMEVEAIEQGIQRKWGSECVISTIPLNRFIPMINPEPPGEVLKAAASLEYRPIVVLGLATRKQNILNASYVYVLNEPYNRISEISKFSPRACPPGENMIALEIPCGKGTQAWHAGAEELFEMCLPSLEKQKLLSRQDVTSCVVIKSPDAYPIYRRDYSGHLDKVQSYIRSQARLYLLGRTGEFMYMDLDQCMRRAFDLADNIAAGFSTPPKSVEGLSLAVS